jgi:hypothetical protein
VAYGSPAVCHFRELVISKILDGNWRPAVPGVLDLDRAHLKIEAPTLSTRVLWLCWNHTAVDPSEASQSYLFCPSTVTVSRICEMVSLRYFTRDDALSYLDSKRGEPKLPYVGSGCSNHTYGQ